MDRGSYRAMKLTEMQMGDAKMNLGNFIKFFILKIINDWRSPTYYIYPTSIFIGLVSSIVLVVQIGLLKGILFGILIGKFLAPLVLKILGIFCNIFIAMPIMAFFVMTGKFKENNKN
jgi:hypothetical protein